MEFCEAVDEVMEECETSEDVDFTVITMNKIITSAAIVRKANILVGKGGSKK